MTKRQPKIVAYQPIRDCEPLWPFPPEPWSERHRNALTALWLAMFGLGCGGIGWLIGSGGI